MKRWLLAVVFMLLSQSYGIASEIETLQSTLYPYKSQIVLQDEFISGNTTSNQMGKLGWFFSNGTTTQLASETNRPGILRRDTGAGAGTVATTYLYGSSNSLLGSTIHDITWMVRLNNNDANTTQRVGVANSVFGISPPDGGIYFEKLDGDTNWFCVTRSATVETRADSGIAVNTSFNTFRYQRLASSVVFSINNTVVCTNTTNIPSVHLTAFTLIVNSAAASKTMDHDYFQIRITSLTR